MIEVRNRSKLVGPAYRAVREVVLRMTRVSDVVAADGAIPNLTVIRNVAYDDHTHDILVSCSSVELSFVATCGGELLSATIWGSQPSDDELLDDRLDGLGLGFRCLQPAGGCCFGGHVDDLLFR